jgi:hypothetical protein
MTTNEIMKMNDMVAIMWKAIFSGIENINDNEKWRKY